MPKTAAIFVHSRTEGPENLRALLKTRGFDCDIIFTFENAPVSFDALAPDLLLVMGGPMGVYEADRYPFLKDEIKILKERLAADRPVLGICLGSQLMAAALGQKIFPGKAGQEIGWAPLTLTEAGKNHPVRHLDGAVTQVFHWHGDTYELPEGATLLASSALYKNQAYVWGENALALQCHPEVSAKQLEGWIKADGHKITESKIVRDAGQIREQTAQHMKTMNRQTKLFFNEWLDGLGL